MKKLLVMAMTIIIASYSAFAQNTLSPKEKAELAKMTKQQIDERASKSARKALKTFEKEGWKVAPGHLPLEKQLDRSFMMQEQYDADFNCIYTFGDAQSVGENYDAAKMQATELAKMNLVSKLQTEVTALVEANISNLALPEGEAASVTEVVMQSKSLISQNIGKVTTVLECYRDLPNKKKEVRMYVACNSKNAMEAAKKAILAQVAKENSNLAKQLEKALDN